MNKDIRNVLIMVLTVLVIGLFAYIFYLEYQLNLHTEQVLAIERVMEEKLKEQKAVSVNNNERLQKLQIEIELLKKHLDSTHKNKR